VGLSLVQSLMLAFALEANTFGQGTVPDGGWDFRLLTMITLTAGTAFIMWLGEQITERGIGNGISLVIFAGIVTAIPSAIQLMWQRITTDATQPVELLLLMVVMFGVLAAIVGCERAQRRIPIQYARRVVGRQVVGASTSYYPMKLNTAGVIPPIFASSLLLLPQQISGWAPNAQWIADLVNDYLSFRSVPYNLVYVGLIVFFAYFYTGVMVNTDDVADNLRKSGGYIPGIRPGASTASYIGRVLDRITAIGALYLAAVCILPVLLSSWFNVPFFFGGTALLIVVGVAIDTMGQVEAHLVSRNYDTFARGRGKAGR